MDFDNPKVYSDTSYYPSSPIVLFIYWIISLLHCNQRLRLNLNFIFPNWRALSCPQTPFQALFKLFSIMCCAILFPAGPEAVLRQPLEDMKACVSGGAWVQPGEGCTWIPLAHNPSSYMTRCMFYIQIFYFSRFSWLRRPSWVPYPLPYPDPSLFTPLSTSSQDE